MPRKFRIHYDNLAGYEQPVLILQQDKTPQIIEAGGHDEYGAWFELYQKKNMVFKFGDAKREAAEDDALWRHIPAENTVKELWTRGWNPFVYTQQPRHVEAQGAADFVQHFQFDEKLFVSDTGGRFACGANVLADGGVLFGLFHPHAAQVYVCGDFNDWQHPAVENADPDKFLAMPLYRGYFDVPNMWLLQVDHAQAGQEYKFYIEYGALNVFESRFTADPYTRQVAASYEANNSLIVDPTQYTWNDGDYHTPVIHDLILYELSVHGFTHEHPHVEQSLQGKFAGITDRIRAGYFDEINVTALSLMPVSEVPTPQGETALGYNTSLFLALERDFGTPDEFREMVDTAHQHGLAVIIDQVFNHAANAWNPLWQLILDKPDDDGGLYFSGESPWGNRMATERAETQNMLIDACKMMIHEYHIDGFRFDFTHSSIMSHDFMHRLADEVQAMKPNVVLIAENMPNEPDMNRQGYNGFAQWNDVFHDGIKAFLREGEFEHTDNTLENLGDLFYFAKGRFAAHTNNVVNYCESHDEHSVSHEVSFTDNLNTPAAKERKSRLGMFATMVAMGQPMIYMGQEFGVERERNHVYFNFPENPGDNGFYQWAHRLIGLRRRYPGLKLNGYDPRSEGEFAWLIGPWLGEKQGHGKRVIGWRAMPNEHRHDNLVVLMNFENHSVEVDIPFGLQGKWVRLASIDEVNDIPPVGTTSVNDSLTLTVADDMFEGFVLPDSSGFIYKWQD